jgi:hypothetical protein
MIGIISSENLLQKLKSDLIRPTEKIALLPRV